MSWTGSSEAPPTARIAALSTSLQPSEKRVADVVAADIGLAVELTAQELADQVGVGRASVVRTAQALGYEGYPQLRVALALEVATTQTETGHSDGTLLGEVRGNVERFASRIRHMTAALTEANITDFIERLDSANRVLVAANGLSTPLGLDMTLRLNSVGRPAEFLPDALAQQIGARQLSPSSVCLVISGSGANKATLNVVAAALEAQAQILSLTSFARSHLTESSDVAIVVPPLEGSFQGELTHTSRVPLSLIAESLIDALVLHRGARGIEARAAVLSVISGSIID